MSSVERERCWETRFHGSVRDPKKTLNLNCRYPKTVGWFFFSSGPQRESPPISLKGGSWKEKTERGKDEAQAEGENKKKEGGRLVYASSVSVIDGRCRGRFSLVLRFSRSCSFRPLFPYFQARPVLFRF